MHWLSFLALLSVGFAIFCVFLAEELDIRKNTESNDTDWSIPFLPLYLMFGIGVVVAIIYALVRSCAILAQTAEQSVETQTTAGKNAKNDDDDDDDNDKPATATPKVPKNAAKLGPPLHRRAIAASFKVLADQYGLVVFTDTIVDVLWFGLAFLAIWKLDSTLTRIDNAMPGTFTMAFLPIYGIYLLLFVVTLVGILRTYTGFRYNQKGTCLAATFGWMPCLRDEFQTMVSVGADSVAMANSHGRAALAQTYQERDVFQDNKLVYTITLAPLRHRILDGIHIALLWLLAGAIFLATMLANVRLNQIQTVEINNMRIIQEMATLTTSHHHNHSDIAMMTATRPPRFLAAGHLFDMNMTLEWPGDVHNKVYHSLVNWHGHVVPVAIIVLPLFIAHGLLLIYSLIAILAYAKQGRPLSEWNSGLAFVVFHILLIIFEALLAARLDAGTLKNASWHNSFAPLYTLFLYVWLAFIVSLCVGSPGSKRQRASRWGIYVVPKQ